MTVRPVFLILALAASILAGCSKSGEQKDAAASAPPAAAAAEATPLDHGALISNGQNVPVDAAARADADKQAERDAQLELKASAAEARARLAEIELRDQTTRALIQQQQAAQMEAARAAQLADQARALDAENATLRIQALENEQRAIEAERAAYGAIDSVIVVQPPQRYGYGNPGRPPRHDPPPQGTGTVNVGLNRPAIPDLTPPGPPATFTPPAGPSVSDPKFDTMRGRKRPVREADSSKPDAP